MRKTTLALFALLMTWFGFMGAAVAGNLTSPDDGAASDYIKMVWDAVTGGQYWLAASGALMLGVVAMRKYFPNQKVRDWMHGQYGQPLSVFVFSFAGAIATGLASVGVGATLSLTMAYAAVKVALAAAGGYSLLKALLVPALTKLGEKAPKSMKWLFEIVLWVFSKPTAVEKAEKAGDAAVVANPPQGAGKNDVAEI